MAVASYFVVLAMALAVAGPLALLTLTRSQDQQEGPRTVSLGRGRV
jgi:hypothetical protein